MAGLLDYGSQPSGGGGLLDFIANDPGSRFGLTMLAASSPKYGRGLMQALQSQEDMKRQQLQAQYVQSQIEENKIQNQARQAQIAQAAQKQALLSGLFGNPLAGVTSGGGLSAPQNGQVAQGGQMPQGGTPSMPQGQGRIAGLTLDQVAALKANGIDVADLWKTGREGFKRESGAYYEGVDGSTKYMPKLDNGMMVSGGQVMPAPGYAQANAGIKGAEAGAVEAARFPYTVGTDAARQNLAANLDVQKVYNPNTGREELLSRAQVVRPQQQYSGAGYAGGSSGAAAEGQRQIMQAELDKLPANHPDRAAIMREMQRLPASQAPAQSGNYAAGPSAAEAAAQEANRVRQVEQAKVDVSPTASKVAAVDTARDALGIINQALTHPGLKTATGIQGTVDPRNYISGTDATNFRVLMDQVKGSVFLDAYKDLRGGGAITDAEGAKAEAAKARINRAQSPDEFVKGLNEYKSIVERGLARAQERAGNQGGASGSWGEKSGNTAKTVVKTGMYGGRRVVQYSDGSVDYAN